MNPRDKRRRTALVVGLLFSALFVYLSLRRIDLQALWHTLATSRWWPWYVLAPVVYMAGHYVRGVRCRTILQPHCEISTWTATNIVIIGYAANNLLPARMGELVRAYVLSRKASLSVSLSLAVTFVERLMDGLAITMMLVVAGYFAPLPTWGKEILWVAVFVFLSGLGGVVLVMVARSLVLQLTRRATAWLPPHISDKILSVLERAISATDCLRDGGVALKIVLLSIGVWLIEGGMFLIILPAFGLPMNPLWAAMALAVTNLGILIPSTPGYIGPFHYFCMQSLMLFGVDRETALGYAIMAHLLSYIPVTTWGVSALAAYGMDLSSAARRSEVAVENADLSVESQPSAGG